MFKTAVQQGRRRNKTGSVPSGVRWGFWRAENAAGGRFQHPHGEGCSKWPSSKAAGSRAT